MGFASDFVENKWKAKVDSRNDPEVDQANLVDAIVLRNSPDRLTMFIQNLSGSAVFLRQGGLPATTTTGVRLIPNGGSISYNVDDDGLIPTEEWHVVGTADNLDIFTQEVFGIGPI